MGRPEERLEANRRRKNAVPSPDVHGCSRVGDSAIPSKAHQTPGLAALGWLALGLCLACGARPTSEGGLRAAREKSGTGARPAFERAFADAGDARRRLEILERWGEVQRRGGGPEDALAVWEAVARDSETAGLGARQAVARIALGAGLLETGRPAAAVVALERALELGEEQADPWIVGLASYHLGKTAQAREDPAEAELWLRRALSALEPAADSLEMARVLSELGVLAWRRGEYGVADGLWTRALHLAERHDPGGGTYARILGLLATVALEAGEYDRAEAFFRRRLRILELDPEHPDGAVRGWTNLANVALARGDLATAAETLERAASLAEETSQPPVILTFYQGVLAQRLGQLGVAEIHFRQVLDHYLGRQPGHPDLTNIRLRLGEVLLADGRPEAALEQLRFAHRGFRTAWAPGWLALVEHRIGDAWRALGQAGEADAWYARALEHLDEQVERLDHDLQRRGAFREQSRELYWDAVCLALDRGRDDEAVVLAERFRASGFRAMLHERSLELEGAPDRELVDERRRLDERIHRLQYELAVAGLAGEAPDETDFERRLEPLRRQRRQVDSALHRVSGQRYRDLQDNRPRSPEALHRALDPGTVLLAYFLGPDDGSLLYVADAGASGWERLGPSKAELEKRVASFRRQVTDIRRPDTAAFGALLAEASDLFADLIEPAWSRIEKAERILILPDGPLHLLPFAALVRTTEDGHQSYLVEQRPLHVALSVAVYEQLRQVDRSGRSEVQSVVAFGDPVYPGRSMTAIPGLASELALRGFELGPIPSTRRELASIAALFGDRGRILAGALATETAAKVVGPGTDILHFAVHAFIHPRSGLDSALALSLPRRYRDGRDNGLLQAWEIFEQVRLDADLVVLSACSTARGQAAGSEGLVGLSRAFQYAGARSVLASLWNVSDTSTATLMEAFYRHLRAGESKDRALRRAQLALIDNEASRAPFYWAAFQLDGDWR